ncbi:HN1_G0034050.mRNA.1.CDS.1 [Saccharomyces cerevisiae]|nr:HN1_G0034050.mRNA.1.CDS.1 [Saccharomyces cerevisiae]CAI4463808.1 BAL_1a_G0020470.mRNA.1.CDS.1 [Saccharomyces cerevisiae]CAI7123764.1 BAL_1a_G0020470.mRNA.1.CDS.1 [Saccharomyces cerevisiae]
MEEQFTNQKKVSHLQSLMNTKRSEQPTEFAKKHRFKDTLALFLVFLSFNHFTSLCLLVSFIVATKCKDFLANCFIVLFLSKKPSRHISEVAHIDISTSKVTNGSSNRKSNSRFFGNSKNSFVIPIPVLICEILFAMLLKIYGGNYFVKPIKNLAISIIASFLINDPSDCLSYATSCSVLYAVSTNTFQRVSHFFDTIQLFDMSLRGTGQSIKLFTVFRKYSQFFKKLFSLFLPMPFKMLGKHSDSMIYYLSFHIFFFSFASSLLHPHRQTAENKPLKKGFNSTKPDVTRVQGLQKMRISSSSSVSADSNTLEDQSPMIPNDPGGLSSSNQTIHPSQQNNSPVPLSSHSNILNPATSYPTDGTSSFPYFTSMVKEYKSYQPSVISAEGSNSQAVTTTTSTTTSPTTFNFSGDNTSLSNEISLSDSSNGNSKKDSDFFSPSNDKYTNQLFELNVDFGNMFSSSKLSSDISVTSNLENFIRLLFRRKNQHLIAPLWSMVVTLKTTNFEKKYLQETSENSLTPTNSNTSYVGNQEKHDKDLDTINTHSVSSRISFTHAGKFKKSVFNNFEPSNTMALIAKTTSDDYNLLNLVSTNENIFNRNDNDYKVCIIDISTNSITFHIENLHDGELIVLVNGVIWSEVSCALILEHVGEEYVVVNGLVPSCSYDIQFINRLNHRDDYLVSDLIVRTCGNNNAIAGKFENLDFSFPSYYHRKFLSPLLTLKHSVLTTNANLSDERTKLKKTKKEISKKLSLLRQEIDYFKGRISQNATHDEKSTLKVENLKVALQQSETAVNKLEMQLKTLTEKELELEEEYLKKKDLHLKNQLEFSKLEESLSKDLKNSEGRFQKVNQELVQLGSKLDKLNARNEKLQKEVDQNAEEIEKFSTQFLSKREKDRFRRKEYRIREANKFELTIKGLEQDINRLENENENIHSLIGNSY